MPQVLSEAYADLGHVLSVQGDRHAALRATYEAFRLATDPLNRMRNLGDLGVELSELGYYDVARIAFGIVVASNTGFIVKTNARLELMEIESASGNRVAFERHRAELREGAGRMPPSMAIDYHYKCGLGLARFGQLARAREVWTEGMRLAEAHHLNEWYFRLERVSTELDRRAIPQVERAEPKAAPAAIADLAAGLTAYAEEAMPA
jgi:tetratricopeptide (TPR) repeat protein